MRTKLTVRNTSAVAANFVGRRRQVDANLRRATTHAGEYIHARTLELMLEMGIYDTGHMYRTLRLDVSPEGRTIEVGWQGRDYEPDRFYPQWVVYGYQHRSGRMIAGRDPLHPAWDEAAPTLRRWQREAVQAGVRGRRWEPTY